MTATNNMSRLHTKSIVNALTYLTKHDKKIKHYVARGISLKFRKRQFCFETFINVVVNQQLSDKASNTIRRRIYDLLDDQVTPTRFLETKVANLRKCGISNQKIQHLRSIATVIQCDPKYFPRLRRQDVEKCRQELLALKGIGPWSSSIITLFYIGHPDVLVEGDVTINKVLSRLYGIEIGDVSVRIHELTEHWRPYRSVGCMLCWHLYDNGMI